MCAFPSSALRKVNLSYRFKWSQSLSFSVSLSLGGEKLSRGKTPVVPPSPYCTVRAKQQGHLCFSAVTSFRKATNSDGR